MLSVRVLGPVEIDLDGVALPALSAKTRTMLAALALEAGRIVSRDRLVDLVWGEQLPDSVSTQVAIQVSKLRKHLGTSAIETVGQGYRLNTEYVAVDAAEAERLLGRAREQHRPEMFREALSLWRGPVCSNARTDALMPAVQRLEDLRLTSTEEWAALELDSGGEADVITVATELVPQHPLRERLRAVLMEALWRCERRGDALALYEDGRRMLADELGLDPGPELSRLQERILQGDDVSASPPAGPNPLGAIPRQLPMDIPNLSGRDGEIGAVETFIGDAASGAVVAIHGSGGVGKTALAVHLGHRLSHRFPDGQIFLNLRGYGHHEPTDTSTALGLLLQALGVSGAAIPDNESARDALYRNTVAGRRLLIVLDNARDSPHVRPLLPGGASTVIVTSRSQLRSLTAREGAHRVAINPLTTDAAVRMLRGRAPDTSWTEDDVTELARLCGHLPVALSVAAERASRFPDRPLAELNAELRDGLGTLDVLTAWDADPHTSVHAVLTWSFDALGADEARLFLLLSVHPPQHFDRYAAAAMGGVPADVVVRLLDRLVDMHLLAEPRPGAYAMHDLVYAYAVAATADRISRADVTEAAHRMRSYYVHTMIGGRSRSKTDNFPLEVSALPKGVQAQEFERGEHVMAWTTDNWLILDQILGDAIAEDDHVASYELAALMAALGADWGNLDNLRDLVELAASHGRAGGIRSADIYRDDRIGLLEWRAGRPAEALALFERSYPLCRELGNQLLAATSLMHQGLALRKLDRVDEAISCYEESVAIRETLGVPTALTLNNLAFAYLSAGRLDDALAAANLALRTFRDEGRTREEAQALDTRGSVRAGMGDHPGAVADFARATELYSDLGVSLNVAIVATHLGDEQALMGDLVAARQSWTRALDVMTELSASDGVHLKKDDLIRRIADADAALSE